VSLEVRLALEDDYAAVAALAARCPPLEAYPLHQYRILLRYCGKTCVLAEAEDGALAGFVLGLVSQTQAATFFLWQIGVSADHRGRGVGRALLARLEKELRRLSIRRVELTIDPTNESSRMLFEHAGYVNASKRGGPCVEVAGRTCLRDHYGPGRHFMLYEKRLEQVPGQQGGAPG
jgi:diaminobutyrate acetyltransferase